MGLTTLTLQLANQLARENKTVFITYQDYAESLRAILLEKGEVVSDNLHFNTILSYYQPDFVTDLKEIIISEGYSNVILDDLPSLLGEQNQLDADMKNELIESLKRLATVLQIRLILNTSLPDQVESRGGDRKPMIRDFTWSRNLIHAADQVLALYRPGYYGITEDESGHSLLHLREVLSLKNAESNRSFNVDHSNESDLSIQQ
jgi:hypothetical protein